MNLTTLLRDPGENWPYTPNELPAIFGAPANTTHPLSRRVAYGFTALLVGLTGALGNSLVLVNEPQLQGALGVYASEIAWLPTAYVMAIVPMNLLLVKFRAQFGVRLFVLSTVTLYCVVILAHLFVHSFASSISVRAAGGIVGAAFTTQSIFYMGQALPMRWRLPAVTLGLGIPPLTVPLARCLFSSELLALGEWHSLYMFELGMALLSLSAVLLFTLPPAPRKIRFERLDLLTFLLFASGAGAVSAVVGLGLPLWWQDTPWLGYVLLSAIPLLVAAILIERHRRNPLLAVELLTSSAFLRFILLSALLHICIAEQTIGAVGLMNTAGLNNDQLHPLFWLVTGAMITGLVASCFVLRPPWFANLLALAFAIVAVAAALDSHVTNLTRPEQLYVSQALMGFATTFAMGPLFLFGLRQALPRGESAFISFLAIFSITVNFGSLGASSLVGTFETLREKTYSHLLVEEVVPTAPQVRAQLAASENLYGPVDSDPALRQVDGTTLVSQRVTHEATILAYIDVFQGICAVAALTAIYLFALILARRLHAWRLVAQGS